MFKKPLGNFKTVSPLSGSDRRKLKQRVIATFGIPADDCDQLVPEGIQSVKFSTHVNEPGVAYLAPDGDPLWFIVGKGSEELIPTVYTLWKKRDLLPLVCTPPSVVRFLVGGADLMIPGVIHCVPSIEERQLVSVCQLDRKAEKPMVSPPLCVGRMALPSDQMVDDAKGKAVFILQTWKDQLWEMGSKGEVPEPTMWGEHEEEGEREEEPKEQSQDSQESEASASTVPPADTEQPPAVTYAYTAEEVTDVLQQSLLQAISTILASLPPSSFPISSTQFYTNYILPCRPAYPASILPPSSAPQDLTRDQILSLINPLDINIKTSTHKSLTTFLKSAEKAKLLVLKSQKHSQQVDLLVTSVNTKHPSVAGHNAYVSVKEAEEKAAKKAKREEREKDGVIEISVRELRKPHSGSVALFKGMGGDPEALYTMQDIRTLLNSYIASQNLVNPNVQAYININPLLSECINAEGQQKKKRNSMSEEPNLLGDYMKRDELLKKVVEKMQDWYEILREGEVSQKKGSLKPILVVVKVRQGRKTSTLITGFEPFLTVDAETIADDLRKACASATSVSPLPGKQAGNQILIQGKHAKAAAEYFISSGVPKQWVEIQDEVGGRR